MKRIKRGQDKTKEQLINELVEMRQRLAEELEASEVKRKQAEHEGKKAEEAMWETHNYFEQLLRYTNVPIIVWDTASRITRFNPTFEHLTGYIAKEVIGRELQMLFPKASKDESLRKIARTSSGEYWKSVEIPILLKDGGVRLALWNSANIYSEGGSTLLATIAQGQDITERKWAEEALRKSRSRLNSILSSMVDLVFVLDKEGRFTSLYVPDEELLTPPEQFVGRRYSEVMPPHVNKVMAKAFDKNKKGEVAELEYQLEIGGETKWYSAKLSPMLVDGEFTGCVIVARNITERKRTEEELKKYHEHLEELVKERTKELKDSQERLLAAERLATLGQFSGSISHELRNPLSVVDSSAYYLKTKLKDADEKVHEHLDRIRSSVGSATAIIESLLNLVKMEEPRLAKADLIAITSDAIATSKVPPGVDVIRKFPEQEVLVNADYEQLRMAFKNIIKNASEAMEDKGTLTVTVRTATDSRAEVSFTDTGPGIAEENLDRVFQPLFSTKAQGIGFGLSISKMVIDKHGGTIEAKSEPGKGATIIIQLPLYPNKDKEM